MKLITFVGTGCYEPILYRWGEREHSTRFFSDALVEWLQPKTTCVVLTEVARQHPNWQELEPLLRGRTEVRGGNSQHPAKRVAGEARFPAPSGRNPLPAVEPYPQHLGR